MTALIVARIHWQALRLWLAKLAIVPKPAPPARHVSRGQPVAATSAAASQDGQARVSPTSSAPAAAENPA
jgi:hypothetical protein